MYIEDNCNSKNKNNNKILQHSNNQMMADIESLIKDNIQSPQENKEPNNLEFGFEDSEDSLGIDL